MKSTARIASILNTKTLNQSITGFKTFDLGALDIPENISVETPHNLRLGHLVEKIVAGLIRASHNCKLLHENVQLIEQKQTIGEIDFILQDVESDKITHLELAYKFYLYDPNVSEQELHNWIGPNRNDSLRQKLDKLKQRQFPLLYHPAARKALKDIRVEDVSQSLCFLASLFVPFSFKSDLSPTYQSAVVGFYINFEKFKKLNSSSKRYYITPKKEWGIDPSTNEIWQIFECIEEHIKAALTEKQSVLCWQKEGTEYNQFFVVWW